MIFSGSFQVYSVLKAPEHKQEISLMVALRLWLQDKK